MHIIENQQPAAITSTLGISETPLQLLMVIARCNVEQRLVFDDLQYVLNLPQKPDRSDQFLREFKRFLLENNISHVGLFSEDAVQPKDTILWQLDKWRIPVTRFPISQRMAAVVLRRKGPNAMVWETAKALAVMALMNSTGKEMSYAI